MELAIILENSCRVCMLSSCELSSIFDETEGITSVTEALTELSGVKIEEDDLLSKKICNVCLSKVHDFLVFRQLCVDSDETVRYNLMLADEDELAIEADEYVSEESLKNDETVMQIEEYFTEEDEVQLDFNAESDTAGYTELFVNDESTVQEDLIHNDPDSDDNSEEEEGNKNNNKDNLNVKLFLHTNEELTEKMREAHIAKEQQKKHKCPHCDKYFMFPSKGL
jgi:Zinc-finger associated domain (zf-AD)